MKNVRFLNKAWLCLCLVCTVTLPSCSVFKSLQSENINHQTKNWTLQITITPVYDLNNIPVAIYGIETYKMALNPLGNRPETLLIGCKGTFPQMQRIKSELMSIGSIICVSLIDQNVKQIIN